MADITVTAANVLAGTGANIADGTLGAAVTAGQSVYLDASSGTYKPSDANLSAAAAATKGVALNGGATGQPVKVQNGGPITIGGTVAVGTVYVASATAGGIAPTTDLASGWFTSVLGIGISATQIQISINISGVPVP